MLILGEHKHDEAIRDLRKAARGKSYQFKITHLNFQKKKK